MTDKLFCYVRDSLKKQFSGFKILACATDYVLVDHKIPLTSKSFLGFQYHTEYSYKEKQLEFESLFNVVRGIGIINFEKYEVFVAVDWHNKIVYWKYKMGEK